MIDWAELELYVEIGYTRYLMVPRNIFLANKCGYFSDIGYGWDAEVTSIFCFSLGSDGHKFALPLILVTL